jgi:hypothetical protein
MNQSIKMKPDYGVFNDISIGDNYVIVNNYGNLNEIENLGFVTKKTKGNYKSRIGRWQPKGTKEQELKSK